MTLDFTDGTLFIEQTADCAFYVVYDNILAAGLDVQIIYLVGFTVTLIKAQGPAAETMTVLDKLTGITYQTVVPDFESGDICVPWAAMA